MLQPALARGQSSDNIGLDGHNLKPGILNSTTDKTVPRAEVEDRTRWRKTTHRRNDALVTMTAPKRSFLDVQVTGRSIIRIRDLTSRSAVPDAALVSV
jgi:hypothetical protein